MKAATHDVILRKTHRDGVHVLIMDEPNKRICRTKAWLADDGINVAIAIINGDIEARDGGRDVGFVCVELAELAVCSCYCSPNVDHQHFETFLAELQANIRQRHKQVIVGVILMQGRRNGALPRKIGGGVP